MNETANPIYIALLFILRCLVPLLVLFGISYLLRRMGLVINDSPEPEGGRVEEVDDNEDEDDEDDDSEYDDDSSSSDNKES